MRKYQVFISSTFSDLKDERLDASRSVLDLGHIPSGMELFPASDTEQLEYIKKIVDECDYYVLIIGGRYGSVDEAGVSFTEKEYAYAVDQKKIVLAFIHGDPGSISLAKSDVDPELARRLSEFRKKVSSGRLVQFWSDRNDLKAKIIISLTRAFSDSPQSGWIRGNTATNEETLTQLNALLVENDALIKENNRLKIFTTTEVEGLAGFDESFKVRYSWTYYSQGRHATNQGSSDLTWKQIFIACAPNFLRPTAPSVIGSSISKYLRENGGPDRSVSVYDSDENTIKVQLMALKLLRVYSATAKGGGVGEFAELTEKGKQSLVDTLAVRSPARD